MTTPLHTRAAVLAAFRRSGTGTPLSASFKIPTIRVSLNFDFRMTVFSGSSLPRNCEPDGVTYVE